VDFAEAVSGRFSPRKLGPYPRPGHMGLLVDKVENARAFIPLLSCQSNSSRFP